MVDSRNFNKASIGAVIVKTSGSLINNHNFGSLQNFVTFFNASSPDRMLLISF
jgi:hypothetical protein